MNKILLRLGVVMVATLPMLASAQTLEYFKNFATMLSTLIGTIFPLVFAAAILGFLVGVGMYLFSFGNDKMKDKAKGVMLWGIIFLVVMFSVYGIIRLVASVLGINSTNNTNITLPTIPTQ